MQKNRYLAFSQGTIDEKGVGVWGLAPMIKFIKRSSVVEEKGAGCCGIRQKFAPRRSVAPREVFFTNHSDHRLLKKGVRGVVAGAKKSPRRVRRSGVWG